MGQTAATQHGNGRTWELKTIAVIVGLLVVVVGWGVTWGTQQAAIADNATRIEECDATLEGVTSTMVDIRVSLARIESDLQHIRKGLDAAGQP